MTWSHDMRNEVTSANGATLTFDNNGNTKTDESGNTYTYNAWNRLRTEKQLGSGVFTGLKYDALGCRIQSILPGGGATMSAIGGFGDMNPQKSTQNNRARVMQTLAAFSFYGFAGLLLFDMIWATAFYPEVRDAVFWTMLVVTFGQIFFWAAWIGGRLRRGLGSRAALIFMSVVSTFVFIANQVSANLRLVTGAWLLLMWPFVIGVAIFKRALLR